MDSSYIKHHSFLKIPYISDCCRFWMLRTNNGMYFNEFMREQYVAIGWNMILKDYFSSSNEKYYRIKSALENPNEYNCKAVTSVFNKCSRFCYEIQNGDILLITDKDRVAFAVAGDYYEENPLRYTKELELSAERGDSPDGKCPYCKRRKIEIITVVHNKDAINPYMYKAILLNKHSLCNMDKYADTILSSCYDAYLWCNNLTMSFKVDKKKDINAVHLADFINGFNSLIPTDGNSDIYVKTSLHSPGDIIFQISNWAAENYLWVFVIWVFIFGGKCGGFELPSLWNVIKYFLERSDSKEVNELEAERIRLTNEKLKHEIEAIKLENERAQKLERAAAELSDAAKKLEINKPRGEIVDISSEILHS